MTLYQLRSVEAMYWSGSNRDELKRFFDDDATGFRDIGEHVYADVGDRVYPSGYWIVRQWDGIHTMSDEMFRGLYEAVEAVST